MRHIFPSSSDIATSARSEMYFGDTKCTRKAETNTS